MDVFCCCGRRHSSKRKAKGSSPPASGGAAPESLPTVPPPAVLATPSSTPLFRRPPPDLPMPGHISSLSSSSLMRTAPIPAAAVAALEPVEISELVIDDSDSGGELSSRRRGKKKRPSSTLEFVKARIRRRVSQDSLRRQSRATVGSSNEELARRAELRRLRHKRIQEELQTDDAQDGQNDGPSMARFSLPGTEQLHGGGPRDHIEFSVAQTGGEPHSTDLQKVYSRRRAMTGRSSRSATLTAGGSARSRRASCPGSLNTDKGGRSTRAASRASGLDTTSSLPHLPSTSPSLPSGTRSLYFSLQGSSGTDERSGTPISSGQAITAVVVSGGFVPKDLTRLGASENKPPDGHSQPKSTQPTSARQPLTSRPTSPAQISGFPQSPEPDDSPLSVWLRSQVLCTRSESANSNEHRPDTGINHDGAGLFETPGDVLPQKMPSLDMGGPISARNESAEASGAIHYRHAGTRQAQHHQVEVADGSHGSAPIKPDLRGGFLRVADAAHMRLPNSWISGQCYRPFEHHQDTRKLEASPNAVTAASMQAQTISSNSHRRSKSVGTLRGPSGKPSSATSLQPELKPPCSAFESRDTSKSPKSSYRTARNSISGSSLPAPGLHRPPTNDAASAVLSDASSFRRREAELQTIPTRFGESVARRKASLHTVSRFREEFGDTAPEAPVRKTSILSRLHLTIPKRARLASRECDGDDGASTDRPSLQWSQYSSMRSAAASRLSYRSPSHLGLPLSDRYGSSRDESAEDVWRRAIRAEAEERSSMARRSSRYSNRTPSMVENFLESDIPRSNQPSLRVPVSREQSKSGDTSRVSPMCTSPALRHYDTQLSQSLERSSRVLEDWSRQNQDATPLPRPSNTFTPLRRISEVPKSWARFPSHTRTQRNGPAGSADDVTARDFAAAGSSTQRAEDKPVWLTDKSGNSSSSKDSNGRPRKAAKKWGRMLKASIRKMLPSRGPRSIERQSSARGSRRSSCQTGGYLEYPELEILPTDAGFKELRALEHEVESIRASPHPYRQPLSPLDLGGADHGPSAPRSRMVSVRHGDPVHYSERPDGQPESSGAAAEKFGIQASKSATVRAISTPSPHRRLPSPLIPLEKTGGGEEEQDTSATNSEQFVTPLSGPSVGNSRGSSASPVGCGIAAASDLNNNNTNTNNNDNADDDATSGKSWSTVINTSRSGTELNGAWRQAQTHPVITINSHQTSS